MALDKTTGKTLWLSNKEASGYSTPLPFTWEGTTYVALSNEDYFLAAEVMSGKKSWEIRWPTRYGVNAADPIIVGNEIWIGSGYGKGHGVYEVKGEETTVRWTNRELRTQQNAPILIDDYLFGIVRASRTVSDQSKYLIVSVVKNNAVDFLGFGNLFSKKRQINRVLFNDKILAGIGQQVI